jgi:hypothetical protein
MELNKEEILVVADVIGKVKEEQIKELIDVQLALVGGGIGETILV